MSAVIEKIKEIIFQRRGDAVLDDPALVQARENAVRNGLDYAGKIDPHDAWRIFVAGSARFVDVRTAEELKFVGHVPDTWHVPWQLGPSMSENPRFIQELEVKATRNEVIFLLCRSGNRSAAAATIASKAGFKYVYIISEGFEGDLDALRQRGSNNGWRYRGLPWVQD